MKSEKNAVSERDSTFWEHLEALRWTILRSLSVLLVLVMVSFGFKDFIFNKIILPPLTSDFHTYRFLCYLAEITKFPALCPDPFQILMINITLSGQFMIHMISSLIIAVVIAVPYLLYEAWQFVRPAGVGGAVSALGVPIGFLPKDNQNTFNVNTSVLCFILVHPTVKSTCVKIKPCHNLFSFTLQSS